MKLLNYLLFFGTSSFFKSIKLLFYLKSKNKTDILFYYPSYLSQQSKIPTFLVPLITSVKKNNLSYLVIEEPNLTQKLPRSKEATPFDILWLLIILLRKFHSGNNYNLIDVKIGSFLSKIFGFKRDIRNVITVSQSLQSIFKGMFPNAILYDYQHGLISLKYFGYLYGNSVAKHIIINKSNVLLHGKFIKNKLLNLKGGSYFKKHSFVVGSNFKEYNNPKRKFNGNILFSLQFTNSHSNELNKILLSKTIEFFNKIELNKLNLNIYIKNHPRFDNCIFVDDLYKYRFVKIAPIELDDCFRICSLHLTEYSSVLFDSIREGVPTLLTGFSNETNIYEDEYDFPSKKLCLINDFDKINNNLFFNQMITKQLEWSKNLCEPFNEKRFIELFI
tara:strand:- start:16703 stop:17869 length:1167 start_codon:yes stop_codon:yes gene_type:complete